MLSYDDPAGLLEKTKLVERFLSYVKLDTQSDEECQDCPSTSGQLELGRRLVDELRELGLADAATAEVEEKLLRHVERRGFEHTWSAACALHALARDHRALSPDLERLAATPT